MEFLQINLNHCKAAHDLLEATIRQRNVDIIILSEANKNRIKPTWYTDRQGETVIGILNNTIVPVENGNGQGFVWIALPEVTLYSCYIYRQM